MPASRRYVRVLNRASRLSTDQRGNALALFAMALPMVIGAVGLAVDTVQWVVLKRELQQVADSAAMAGSFTAIQGGDIDYAVDADAERRRSDIPKMQLRAALSPEGHDGDPNAVAVTISAPAPLSFASLFLSKPLLVSASATATMVETNDFCAFAIDSGSDNGITIAPNSTVQSECGIATNSSAPDAVRGDASSQFAASKLFAFGGITGVATDTPTRFHAHALSQKDPGADLAMPEIPNTGCPNLTINPDEGRSATLKPGCFGNLVLNGHVTLEPGNYILNRGNIVFGPRADVECDGCTFFLTSDAANSSPASIGKARIDPSATIQLTAPTEGDYTGLLMFQDRRALPDGKDEENLVGANERSKLDGLLYFPSQGLKIDAASAADLRCARLIGRKLILSGHILIAKGCTGDNGKIALKGAEVRLVS